MINHCQQFFRHLLFAVPVFCTFFTYSGNIFAWGEDGHSAIGMLAMTQLQADARSELASIVNLHDEQALAEACNWPDVIRETEEWEFTSPFHYINIPRGDFEYLQSRDCADGRCATQAIKRYARELADHRLDKEQRWQAFAFVCHMVGDLHQPLHAGFADDRGGNNFDIVVRGEQMNLHGFWDHELTDQYAGDRQLLVGLLGKYRPVPERAAWTDVTVNDWTNQSHQLAKTRVYPENIVIDHSYTRQSWELAQQRLSLAASRLAWIINTILQNEN